MKKFLKSFCLALVLIMLLTLPSFSALAAYDESVVATPTSSTIYVDGYTVAFTAYTINGSNYFKLRDVAQAFNYSQKEFEVSWDGDLNAINVLPGISYTPVGGELFPPRSTAAVWATPSYSTFLINSWESVVMAYLINGNTYFRLRDLASTMNFGLDWDGSTNSITIDTTVGYDSGYNGVAGGSNAELIGGWSGYLLDGNWGTLYFYWNGSAMLGYGDDRENGIYNEGYYSYALNSGVLTLSGGDGSTGYYYSLSRMDDSVSLTLTLSNGSYITLFKH